MEIIHRTRLRQIVEVLDKSTQSIKSDSSFKDTTGFQMMNPKLLIDIISKIPSKSNQISLDLGCGNGAWALLTASVGIKSHGIDINPYLIKKAEDNKNKLIDQSILKEDLCHFACGNFYPESYSEDYQKFANKNQINPITMPTTETEDPYKLLNIKISDADIIYAYTWQDQMPFLSKFLEKETKESAIFILPHSNPSIWKLKPILKKPIFVGTRNFK